MKSVLFTFLAAILTLPLISQESLLDDLLGVQPVEMKVEVQKKSKQNFKNIG